MELFLDINNLIRNVAKKAPLGRSLDALVRGVARYAYYKPLLDQQGIREERMLVIGTIARSGTHYAMILLSNYLSIINGQHEPVTPAGMNDMFPNNWHINYMSYHKLPLGPYREKPPRLPHASLKGLNLDEVTRSHSIFQKIFWRHHKVLHLYRNPLDYSVSLFNYKHKKRPDLPERCNSPQEVLDIKFENYCDMYLSYIDAAQAGSFSVLRISYENLISEPEFWLGAIIEWLGGEVDRDAVCKAVQNSTIRNVKKAEKTGSEVNPDAVGLHGSFISSGQVGQWREYYSESDLAHWRKKFAQRGINLDELLSQ